MVGEQFTPEQRKFMVLSYHQTGSQVLKRPQLMLTSYESESLMFVALRRTGMARRAMRDMGTRAIKCVELEGGHIEGRN